MARPRRRSVTLPGALLAIAVALAIGFGAGFYTRSATATTSTVAPTSTSTSTTVPPTSTPTSVVPVARCVGSDLTAAEAGSQGTAGTVEATFEVTDAAASPCRLLGYPRLQLLAADGSALATYTEPAGASFSVAAANARPRSLRLAPGASATFLVQFSQTPVGTEQVCPTSARVAIYPPGSASAATATAKLDPCDGGLVNVSPFYGATG